MNEETKNYTDTKVYFDGSHYIGIPKENYPHGKGCKKQSAANPTPEQTERKAKFETAYKESQSLPRRERKKYIAEKIQGEFETAEQAKEYIAQNLERKRNNAAKRYTRLWRKIYTQRQWDYFVTFTFDDKKHTAQSFKETLRNALKHLVSRKGWKYIGVWERSKNERLHFHGIFVIPQMIGKLETVTDYDTRKHCTQTILQNTHFAEQFGRNDFKEICSFNLEVTVKYILKYIEKSGEKLVYGGDLPEYIDCHILAEDVVCPIGIDDKKILLFDDFTCIDNDGVLHGKATSPEAIAQMPKAN